MSDIDLTVAPILGIERSAEVTSASGVNSDNARLFKERLRRALHPHVVHLLLHAGNVTVLDSSGIGFLTDLAERVAPRGGSVVLVQAQPKIKLMLGNLGASRNFRFEGDGETARAFLRERAEEIARSPRLVALDGPEEGAVYPLLTHRIIVGSAPSADLPLPGKSIDRAHCEVYRSDGKLYVRDLGSAAGTFVDDRRIEDEPVQYDEVLRVGALRLALKAGRPASGERQ